MASLSEQVLSRKEIPHHSLETGASPRNELQPKIILNRETLELKLQVFIYFILHFCLYMVYIITCSFCPNVRCRYNQPEEVSQIQASNKQQIIAEMKKMRLIHSQ